MQRSPDHAQTIGALPRGDRAGLVLAGMPANERLIEPTSDLQSLVTRVAGLKPAR